ncbi:hypothetical protein [Streptomyces sp. CCM_MD2014]|uniref:hypothetical protein n=1 Tax=Streptomyces sp. CCM_MD2014 TaxID=1561022 RepID=UPI00052A44C8|nr:hypothetical protein [Streptomyces sp. CCM_MD2014]AIV35600.1 hypothetical protein NI25_20600 [Streptomyces sp. CCM_MD2014]
MSDDQDLVRAFEAMAEGAFRPAPPMDTVELETDHGRELLLYSVGEGGQVLNGGTLLIPADTPANIRRAALERGCPLCPDVNQGLMSHEIEGGPGEGRYAVAVYQECGHRMAIRLDGDAELVTFEGA